MNVMDVENNPHVLEYLFNLLMQSMEMHGFIGEKNSVVNRITELHSAKVLHELAVYVKTKHSAMAFAKLMLAYPRSIREQELAYFKVMKSRQAEQ